jgi:hypothetical protein
MVTDDSSTLLTLAVDGWMVARDARGPVTTKWKKPINQVVKQSINEERKGWLYHAESAIKNRVVKGDTSIRQANPRLILTSNPRFVLADIDFSSLLTDAVVRLSTIIVRHRSATAILVVGVDVVIFRVISGGTVIGTRVGNIMDLHTSHFEGKNFEK